MYFIYLNYFINGIVFRLKREMCTHINQLFCSRKLSFYQIKNKYIVRLVKIGDRKEILNNGTKFN